MPEEVSTDVKDTAPEPSTGQTITPPSDAEGYSKWRLTGEVEKKPPKRETSAPSNHSAEAIPDEEAAEGSVPDPEPGQKQEHRKGTAESRLNQILADLKRAGLSPSELKTFKREAQQAPPAASSIQTQPVQQTSVNPPAQPKPLTEPKLEDFKDWNEFSAAQRAYNDQHMEARFRAMLAEQQMQQQSNERLKVAKQRLGDEAEPLIRSAATRLFQDQSVHPMVKGIVNESPVIEYALYAMETSPPEQRDAFLQLARTNPGEASRQFFELEQHIKKLLQPGSNGTSANGTAATAPPETSAPPMELPDRDDLGRFIPAKKGLPPPATELSGRASTPPHEADAAFTRGDVRAYFNAKNREQIAARKGR